MTPESHFIVDTLGYLAAVIVFLTFCMKRMMALRITAVSSNIAFIVYALAAGLTPILILHGTLLPMNLWRLFQMRREVQKSGAAADAGGEADRFDWLIPIGRKCRLPAGTELFAKGDVGESLFVVSKGELLIQEVNVTLGPGAMLGEMSLFTSDHRRTATAVAATDVELAEITQRRVKELYFDNPEFGYNLVRLITQRLVNNAQQSPSNATAKAEA